jgi:glycosyltransferase involved in cell wall biosynthesis
VIADPLVALAAVTAPQVGSPTLRILCLDIEGGHGGSSRSLFELVSRQTAGIIIEVICRRGGSIEAAYRERGISSRVMSWLPAVNAFTLRRRVGAVVDHVRALTELWRHRADVIRLAAEIEERFDVVHCNHESLALVAGRLRRHMSKPVVFHVRSMPHGSGWSRWQAKRIARLADHVVFITENERDACLALGLDAPHSVIYNAMPDVDPRVGSDPRIPADGRLKVACLANNAWYRGNDQLVLVAEALAARGRRDIQFVMAGDMAIERSAPGALGALGRAGRTLADYAEQRGVQDMFLFLGHVASPATVLVACDVVAKPTRSNDPWGRALIEAFSFGLPVMALGTWTGLVRKGETGILTADFDAEVWADALVRFADDRPYCRTLGERGRLLVRSLCDPEARATDLAKVWRQVASARVQTPSSADGRSAAAFGRAPSS